MSSRALKWTLICSLVATFTYPLSESFARNGGLEVTLKIEACVEGDYTLAITESYSALGKQIGDEYRRYITLPSPSHPAPSDSGPVENPKP